MKYIDLNDNENDIQISNNKFCIDNTWYKIIYLTKDKISTFSTKTKQIQNFLIYNNCIVFANKKFQIDYSKTIQTYDNKLYIIRNNVDYSAQYKNDLFILNHRCAHTAIRDALMYLKNEISYQKYIESNDMLCCRGLKCNSLELTKKLIQNENINIFFFFRDPIDYVISCINTPIFNGKYSIDTFLNRIENEKNISSLDKNMHCITQYELISLINQPFNRINLINVENITKFFKKRYGIDFQNKHITKHKFVTKEMITQDQLIRIKNLYKNDFLLKQNFII